MKSPRTSLVVLASLAGLAMPATGASAAEAGAGKPAAPGAAAVEPIMVTVANPLSSPRANETIVLSLAELHELAPKLDLKTTLVVDARGAPVLSQLMDRDGDDVPDQIVFQADFGGRETKTFNLTTGARPAPSRGEYKVYGRFVRERHDDFAWENDRVAHRVYGPDLETWSKEPLVSSGVDTWAKRVPKLIVNDWYLTDDYHRDQGEGADFYAVGKSRGCGGLGIWAGGQLAVSRNFTTTRVLANGPIRLVFVLTYAPWDAGGARVSERRVVTLDAGTPFNRFESTFTTTDKPDKKATALPVGIGIAKHPGNVQSVDAKAGWMDVWEPLDGGQSGHLGCAVVLPPQSRAEVQHTDAEYLLVTAAPASGPLTYYVGSAWDRAGVVADGAAWNKEARSLSARLAAPLHVKLSAGRAR